MFKFRKNKSPEETNSEHTEEKAAESVDFGADVSETNDADPFADHSSGNNTDDPFDIHSGGDDTADPFADHSGGSDAADPFADHSDGSGAAGSSTAGSGSNPDMDTLTKFPNEGKRRKFIIPIILVLLVAALGVGGYFLFNTREAPQETVFDFLAAAKLLDFDKMQTLVQSKDMSVLDETDVKSPVFRNFFLQNNKKFTFEIANSRLNIRKDTAQVTAHLKYLDNQEVYRQALSELLRQVVENTMDKNFSEDTEAQETILTLLRAKQSELGDNFIETDVVYNLIKVDKDWKLVSLDRETVRAITANCVSVQQEINRLQEGDTAVADNRHLEEDGSFDVTTDNYSIKYASHEISTDFSGKPCLLLFYDYTNLSEYPAGALIDVSLQVLQHGKVRPAAIPDTFVSETDSYLKEVEPGETARICQAFSLEDLSDVTVQVYEGSSLSGGNINSVVIRVEG